MTKISTSPASDRLWFLDWVRVGAFALLIPYHLGMFYVSWDWHVKSSYDGSAVEPLMLVTSPWRLALLFFVSGAATRFLAERRTRGAFAAARLTRLLPPLLFGMFVVCAPQAYFEGVAKDGLAADFLAFLPRYWSLDAGLRHGFTWNHLWFVAYLLVYTLLLVPMAGMLQRGDASRWFGARFAVLLVPALAMGVPYAVCRFWFPITHDLVHDWSNHVVYLPLFLLGFVAVRAARFWQTTEALRWSAFACAVATYPVLLWSLYQDQVGVVGLVAIRLLRCVYAWSAILTVLGFAQRHCNRASATVAWLNRGVFCFYIVHQTAIVLFGVWLAPLRIGPLLEPLAIAALTVAACLVIYVAAERFGPAKLLLGLPPRAVQRKGAPQLAVT
jgi:glucans biosynthesis protein C